RSRPEPASTKNWPMRSETNMRASVGGAVRCQARLDERRASLPKPTAGRPGVPDTGMGTSEADRPPGWAASVALLAGVVAAGAVAVQLAPDGRAVATFWPAAGLGLILLALSAGRRWLVLAPLFLAATAAGDLIADRTLRLGVTHGVVETLALVIAALLVTRGI